MAAEGTYRIPCLVSTASAYSRNHDPHRQAISSDSSPLAAREMAYAEPHYETPLYTEINIPLPPLPVSPHPTQITGPVTPTTPSHPRSPPKASPPQSRHRSHSLSALSPFHRRRVSDPTANDSPQRDLVEKRKDRRIELSMGAAGRGRRQRSGTLDAAIVPAVMLLRAELFTPGQAEAARKRMEGGKDKLEVLR